jgi:hypothetical protein
VDPTITELLSRIQELSEEELADLETRLRSGYDEIRNGESITAEQLATLREHADALDSVRTENERRSQERAQMEQELAALDSRVTEPETQTEEGQQEGSEETPQASEETPESAEGEGGGESEPEPQPVAASGRRPTKIKAPSVRNLRAPVNQQPRRDEPRISITASADIPGVPTGKELEGIPGIADALRRRWQSLRNSRGSGEVYVATIRHDWPEERTLTASGAAENKAKIDAVLTPLVAAGGLCAPVEAYYRLASIESNDRPVRDSLANFGAERGGIRHVPTPKLSAFSGAVGVTTVAEDDANATKPCLSFECDDETTVQVTAISRCLKFGNFNDRFYPEMVETFTEKAIAFHARQAERELLDGIKAAATQVTTDDTYGASRTLLTAIERAVTGYRSRNRISSATLLRGIFPFWARGLIRADLTRHQNNDRFEATDAQIADWFRLRGVEPGWALDGPSTGTAQEVGAQAAGALNAWPSEVQWALFHEGAFLFLDGGELNLGVVRDSTLNVENSMQVFAETWEAVAFVGVEALWVSSDVCPDGTYAPSASAISCTVGS